MEPKSCWGCQDDDITLVPKTSVITGNEEVMVCPDCLAEIESIEKEITDETKND